MTSRHSGWMALAVLLIGSSAAAQSAGDSLPPILLPGRLIDVGGWRLHLNCTGRATPSQPIVILEAGIGDFSVEWSLVQAGGASFARVCSDDRAGEAWGDVGPHPRTMPQIVYDWLPLAERA